jgi:hypothetical protein
VWFSRAKPALIGKSTGSRPLNRTVQRIDRVLSRLGLAVIEADSEMRCVVLPPEHTYRVKLYAWPDAKARICLVSSIDYRVDRDLILRELALDLLEENHVLVDEAFVLIPRADQDRLIGCRRLMPAREVSDEELLNTCTVLIERMRRMVARLYAKGLIPSGPSAIAETDH